MYPPAAFISTNSTLLQTFLQQHYFGLLLSQGQGMHLSPLPFIFEWQAGKVTAYCHLARTNPQLQHLDGGPVMIVVQGPHAFVAAGCYRQQPAVSTWNYAIAELRGTARLLNEEDTLALVQRQEENHTTCMVHAVEYQQKLVKAIVGVEINVQQLLGRFKLSQNKPAAEQLAVIRYLQQTEQPATVWQWMQARRDGD